MCLSIRASRKEGVFNSLPTLNLDYRHNYSPLLLQWLKFLWSILPHFPYIALKVGIDICSVHIKIEDSSPNNYHLPISVNISDFLSDVNVLYLHTYFSSSSFLFIINSLSTMLLNSTS